MVFRHGTRPRHPSVEIRKPCPANPVAVERSPIEVTVNGEPAEIFGAVDYPCAVDGYQVNFRIPADMVPATATIQLSAAWISRDAFRIAFQSDRPGSSGH